MLCKYPARRAYVCIISRVVTVTHRPLRSICPPLHKLLLTLVCTVMRKKKRDVV